MPREFDRPSPSVANVFSFVKRAYDIANKVVTFVRSRCLSRMHLEAAMNRMIAKATTRKLARGISGARGIESRSVARICLQSFLENDYPLGLR